MLRIYKQFFFVTGKESFRFVFFCILAVYAETSLSIKLISKCLICSSKPTCLQHFVFDNLLQKGIQAKIKGTQATRPKIWAKKLTPIFFTAIISYTVHETTAKIFLKINFTILHCSSPLLGFVYSFSEIESIFWCHSRITRLTLSISAKWFPVNYAFVAIPFVCICPSPRLSIKTVLQKLKVFVQNV